MIPLEVFEKVTDERLLLFINNHLLCAVLARFDFEANGNIPRNRLPFLHLVIKNRLDALLSLCQFPLRERNFEVKIKHSIGG